TDSMGWHGNAILTHKSAQVTAHDILHIPCLEPRGAVMAQVEIKGIDLSVFGMHLDLSGLWRRRQAGAIVKLTEQYGADTQTVVRVGMIVWVASGGWLCVVSRRYTFDYYWSSFHTRGPIAALDRVMHCDRLKAIAGGVHDSAASRKASDHLPIWAQI